MTVPIEGLSNDYAGFIDWIQRKMEANEIAGTPIVDKTTFHLANEWLDFAVTVQKLNVPQSFEHVLRLLEEQAKGSDKLPEGPEEWF